MQELNLLHFAKIQEQGLCHFTKVQSLPAAGAPSGRPQLRVYRVKSCITFVHSLMLIFLFVVIRVVDAFHKQLSVIDFVSERIA